MKSSNKRSPRYWTGGCSTNWSTKPLTLLSLVAQSYSLKAQIIWGLKTGLMAFLYFSYLYPFRLVIIDGNIDSCSEIEWIFHFACVIIIWLLKFNGTWLSRMISSVGPASWTKYGSLDRTSLALETEARLFYVSKERYDVVLVKLPS